MRADDPLEGGPCYQLYTVEFYQMCMRKLNPGGIFVTQSGQAGITRHHLVWSPVNATLRQVFPAVRAYNQAVYSFMDEWGWNMAFVDDGMGALLSPEQASGPHSHPRPAAASHPQPRTLDLALAPNGVLAPLAQVDARISERISGELRFLDGESYTGLFALSKAHRKTLAAEARVLSRERGTFALMHSQGLCVAGGSGNGSAKK